MMNKFLDKYLEPNSDAWIWVKSYLQFCHDVDDIIDGDKTDPQFILATFRFAPMIYSNNFYLSNFGHLYSLVIMGHDCYAESVRLEKSEREWERNLADFLRQNANEVILKCIEIQSGLEMRHMAAMELRTISYKTHHDEIGKAI